MKSFFTRLSSFYRNIKSKIAFYPTVFALLGLLFAFLMMYLESRGISDYLVDNIPILVVDNGDTALTILSACITGLISMMVFSFSMVMLLLNQASTNYSPRLLPGLISDKSHQIILGIYLSSILYCIFILLSIQPNGESYQVPGFAVLLGILSTVVSIYAFIYFIHNISQSIQITQILDEIYISAKKRLNQLLEREPEYTVSLPNSSGWFKYLPQNSGYYQDLNREDLLNFCKRNDVRLEILPVKGTFILEGTPFFKSDKNLSDEQVKTLLSYFHFSRAELIETNYVFAFKQITEVIVKAMSPGINDPGTAVNGIDYLTELLRLRMLKSDVDYIAHDDTVYIMMRTVNFDELLYNVMASLRTYCKRDIIVVQKLGIMFKYLRNRESKDSSYYQILEREAERLFLDAAGVLDNKADLEVIHHLATELNLDLKHLPSPNKIA